MELPPIVNLPIGSVPSILPEKEVEIHFSITEGRSSDPIRKFSQISNTSTIQTPEEFCEEIISRPVRRRNPKKNKNLQGIGHCELELRHAL